MKNRIVPWVITLLLQFTFLYDPVLHADEAADLKLIRQTITENAFNWIASKTSVSAIPWHIMEIGLLQSFHPASDTPASWPTPNPAVESMSFPSRFDWRENGGYTPARQQGMGDCYPCWAFSLIGAAESAYKITTGIERDLSEQQLLDCNSNGYGCSGGFVDGWTALRDYGMVEESCYPYIDEDGECVQSYCTPIGWIAGVYPVSYTIKSLKYALLHHGALSCSMTVYNDFMFYSEGCYENPGIQPINHGVIIVGWDDSACDDTGAWLVKNSWGTGWGDEGIAYMKYGTCNIGRDAQWFEFSDMSVPKKLHYKLLIPEINPDNDDWFIIERNIGNPGSSPLQMIEFIILDACGGFWYYPAFSQDTDWTSIALPRGQYRSEVLLAFPWPDGVTVTGGIRFWGACFNAGSYDLLAWSMAEKGFQSAVPVNP